jgi:cbb3-type cytochrome oxidase subunit 3
MTLQIFALLMVTVSFISLALFVFSPRNKSYFEAMSKIPLENSSDEETSHRGEE